MMIHDDLEDRAPLSSSFDGISGHAGDLSLEGISGQEIDAAERQRIWIEDGVLMPDHAIYSAIMVSLKKNMRPMGYAWKMVPEDIKLQYTEEFKKQFTWDLAITPRIMKLVKSKVAETYKDMIHTFKENRNEDHPSFIDENVWKTWLAYWDTGLVKKKSKKANSNSLIESDGHQHVASLEGTSVHSEAIFPCEIVIGEMQAKMKIQEDLLMQWQQSWEKEKQVIMEQQQALLQQMQEQLVIIEQIRQQQYMGDDGSSSSHEPSSWMCSIQ